MRAAAFTYGKPVKTNLAGMFLLKSAFTGELDRDYSLNQRGRVSYPCESYDHVPRLP